MKTRELFWPLSVLALIGVAFAGGGVSSGGELDWVLSVVDALFVSALVCLIAAVLTSPIALLPLIEGRYGSRWTAAYPVVLSTVAAGFFLLLSTSTGGPVK